MTNTQILNLYKEASLILTDETVDRRTKIHTDRFIKSRLDTEPFITAYKAWKLENPEADDSTFEAEEAIITSIRFRPLFDFLQQQVNMETYPTLHGFLSREIQ